MGLGKSAFNTAFSTASYGVGSPNPTPEYCVENARYLFDQLKHKSLPEQEALSTVMGIRHSLRLANKLAGTPESSTGYDVWVLDRAWDKDPLNCKSSNAVMEAELAKRVSDSTQPKTTDPHSENYKTLEFNR